MDVIFDVVDLLQLQEIWGRRPIVTAFTRLEPRSSFRPEGEDFRIEGLLPRLTRLRSSPTWYANQKSRTDDPANMPLGSFPQDCLHVLYPEADSPQAARQMLFIAAYNRFVVTQFKGEAAQTALLLRTLAQAKHSEIRSWLNADTLPLIGAEDWIPADLVDSIRSLDCRYHSDTPGTPATYVIADEFWPLLIKADEETIDKAVRAYCEGHPRACREAGLQQFQAMIATAQMWYRSPSVVGLCYQIN